MIYLGALASLRENKQFLFRSDWLSFCRRRRLYETKISYEIK